MSITSYNGGAIVAMRGKDCVVVAADRRFGIQNHLVSCNFQKIFQMGPTVFLGLAGLATDVQTIYERLTFRKNMYELREGREVTPATLMSMLSTLLYEHRFGPYFIEPIICGLHPKTNESYVGTMDLIGCKENPEDFVVAGTCREQLYGMCEVLWEPDMSPDALFEACSQALVNACDRDAISGWGGIVYIIEKDKITTKTLKTRMD